MFLQIKFYWNISTIFSMAAFLLQHQSWLATTESGQSQSTKAVTLPTVCSTASVLSKNERMSSHVRLPQRVKQTFVCFVFRMIFSKFHTIEGWLQLLKWTILKFQTFTLHLQVSQFRSPPCPPISLYVLLHRPGQT